MRCTSVVGDIERILTAVIHSRTIYPLVLQLAVDQHPVVAGLEVIEERNSNRLLRSGELLIEDYTLVITADLTHEEQIIGILSQAINNNHIGVCYKREVCISRNEGSSSVYHYTILPCNVSLSIPSDDSCRVCQRFDMQTGRLRTSRNRVDEKIINMQVVITIGYGGLAIERQTDRTVEAGQVNCILCLIQRNIVVYILSGTVVRPLTENRPAFTIVGSNEYCKLIIRLVALRDCGIGSRRFAQCHIESQLDITRCLNYRRYEPVVTRRTVDIAVDMLACKYTRCTAVKCPAYGCRSQICAICQYLIQQARVTTPFVGR